MSASEDFRLQKEPTPFTNFIWLVSKQCEAYRGLLNVVMSIESSVSRSGKSMAIGKEWSNKQEFVARRLPLRMPNGFQVLTEPILHFATLFRLLPEYRQGSSESFHHFDY